MLSFLKRIRKKQLNGRYLKYAIGEIFLVVIGILIALSINNWNEHSKEQKAVKVYLHNLINDLAADTTNFNAHLKDTQRNINFGKEIMASLDTITTKSNVQDFVLKLQGTGRIFFPQIARNTFLELQNSGTLKSINNDTITSQLRDYYLSDLAFWEQNYVDRTTEGLLPVVTDILPFYIQEQILEYEVQNNIQLRPDAWRYEDLELVFREGDTTAILARVKKSQVLDFHLKNATRAHILQLRYDSDIINSAKLLIDLLKTQLATYD